MRVIKVVHVNYNGSTGSELEKQQFALQYYNITNFIEKYESDIKSKFLNNHRYTKPFSLADYVDQDIRMNASLLNIDKERKSEPLNFYYHDSHDNKSADDKLSKALSGAIKDTAEALLKDITDHLNPSDVLSLEEARAKYPRTNNLSVGTYTLHPYDSKRLSRLEHFHKNLALEKDDELIVLLGRMGAKSVRIMETNVLTKEFKGSTKTEFVSFDVKGDIQAFTDIDRSSELLASFEGNVIDIDPQLLEESLWFSNDSRLNSIFESRRFNLNKIEEYTLVNTYTETFDFDFDLAAKYLLIEADLKAEYQSISRKERYFHVDFGR